MHDNKKIQQNAGKTKQNKKAASLFFFFFKTCTPQTSWQLRFRFETVQIKKKGEEKERSTCLFSIGHLSRSHLTWHCCVFTCETVCRLGPFFLLLYFSFPSSFFFPSPFTVFFSSSLCLCIRLRVHGDHVLFVIVECVNNAISVSLYAHQYRS